MGQEIAIGTDLPFSLRSALQRIEREPPGTRFSISSQTRSQAIAAASAIDAALKSAPPEQAERWLEALGLLTATNPDDGDAKLKIHAISRMLEFPARCYNRSSLDAAARRFRFFPAYSEICDHLEGEARELKRQRHDLRRVLALPVQDDRPPPRYQDLTPEQRAAFDAAMAPFRRGRKEADAEAQEAAARDPDRERSADA